MSGSRLLCPRQARGRPTRRRTPTTGTRDQEHAPGAVREPGQPPSKRPVRMSKSHEAHVRIPAARIARVLLVHPLKKQRARGMPDAGCTRSRACSVESTRVSHHRYSRSKSGIPRAMVLAAYNALSSVSGLFSHRRPAIRLAKLDPSVGRSGPHALAVRGLPFAKAARRVLVPAPPKL